MSPPPPAPGPVGESVPARRRLRGGPRLLPVLLASALVACGTRDTDAGAGATPGGEVLISAAASLTDAFTELARDFESANPGTAVVLNLAGSSTLRTQILEGAPIDVFASADPRTMEEVVEAGATDGEPRVFARNRLRIAVPRGNPGGITGLADLSREELLVGLCAREVPCGALAREALARAGITPSVDTEEPDVRALLTKVALGELDAAVTYVTDIVPSGPVDGVDLPADQNVETAYPIAVLARAPNPEAARAFVEFVLSPEAGKVLRRFGFNGP